MQAVYIVAAKRTAIGTFNGALSKQEAPKLGAATIKAVLADAQLEGQRIDEVIMGQVLTAGSGQNPARQAAHLSGIPVSVPSFTLNKVCGSGMKAIALAAQNIRLGDSELMIAGGQENMSLAPHLLMNGRSGQKLGQWPLQDSVLTDGLSCALSNGIHMGITAENLAKKYQVSREDQDAFALYSQQKAQAAIQSGAFEAEIVGLKLHDRKNQVSIFDTDEHPRLTSLQKLSQLKPVFDPTGTVTAGNASGINDGAAAVLLASKFAVEKYDLPVLAKIIGFSAAAIDPTIMGIGPVAATQKLFDKIGWQLSDVDLIESNEAFAAQSLSVIKLLGLDPAKVNIHGGAIALGHPIGASGARIVVTLLHALLQRNLKRGLATMCIGGGQGVALAIETCSTS